jgi:DnaJ-class molecular chaperone
MARVTNWNSIVQRETEVGFLEDAGQPCPACRGRGDEDCLTCGGEGYV